MANVKITDLVAYTDPVSTDVLAIVDVGADTTKKVSIADLLQNASSGTAAAPGIAFDGDNTGIYSPGANQIALATNGAGRLFIDGNGQVGIGTTSPSDLLQLGGSEPYLRIASSASQTGNNIGGIRFTTADPSYTAGDYPAYINAKDFSVNGSAFGLVFGTQAQDRVVINNLGNVGIGTASPVDGKLEVFSTSYQIALKTSGATGNLGIGMFANGGFVGTRGNNGGAEDVLRLGTSGQERLRIDSSGRLLVGTSSSIAGPNYLGTSKEQFFQIAAQGDNTGLSISAFRSNNIGVPNLVMQQAAGSFASPTIVPDSRVLGVVQFNGYDGSNFIRAGNIKCEVDGTPGANDMPGRLVFSTTASGAASPTERMRIDSAGNLLVGTSTAIATVDHLNAGFTPQTQVANQGGISSALLLANFRNNNSVVPQLVLQKARGDFASPVIVNNNDTFGAIDFNGYDGSSYLAGAIIKAEVDGPPGTNDMPGRLVFSTTADGADEDW